MMKSPSRTLWKVFVFIIPQVIRMHISKWEVLLAVVVVCRLRTPREIIILLLPQVIQLRSSSMEE